MVLFLYFTYLVFGSGAQRPPCTWDVDVAEKPFCGTTKPLATESTQKRFTQGNPGNPCRGHSNVSSLPFCDSSLSINGRVKDLLARMTLDEKITQLTTGNGVNGGTSNNAVPRLGIPK